MKKTESQTEEPIPIENRIENELKDAKVKIDQNQTQIEELKKSVDDLHKDLTDLIHAMAYSEGDLRAVADRLATSQKYRRQ